MLWKGSVEFTTLVEAVLAAESRGVCVLYGLYSHAGNSYTARGNISNAAKYLMDELTGLLEAGNRVYEMPRQQDQSSRKLVLSVGATPTAMLSQLPWSDLPEGPIQGIKQMDMLFDQIKFDEFEAEIHAGV
jgi:hypothetical protein